MLSQNFDFEKAKDLKIRQMGVGAYLQQFKVQIDLMPWSNEQKFEEYYIVRSETLKKYAA